MRTKTSAVSVDIALTVIAYSQHQYHRLCDRQAKVTANGAGYHCQHPQRHLCPASASRLRISKFRGTQVEKRIKRLHRL
jgi:hypothetical protein